MTLADFEWDFAGDPAGNLEGPRFIHRTYLVRIVNAFLSREAGEGDRAPKRVWWRGEAAGRAERSSPYTLSRSDRNFVEEAFPPPPALTAWERKEDQTACKPGSVPPCLRRTRRPFLWTDRHRPVLATYPGPSERRRSYPPVSRRTWPARDPYSVLLLAGLAMRPLSPAARCALTAPFHPSLRRSGGGLLSVALSLGSPPVGVTHRHVVVEPGLSSSFRPRPPGRLIRRGKWRTG